MLYLLLFETEFNPWYYIAYSALTLPRFFYYAVIWMRPLSSFSKEAYNHVPLRQKRMWLFRPTLSSNQSPDIQELTQEIFVVWMKESVSLTKGIATSEEEPHRTEGNLCSLYIGEMINAQNVKEKPQKCRVKETNHPIEKWAIHPLLKIPQT